MYPSMTNRLFPLLPLIIGLTVASVMAQDITGGGSLVRDITGGAALIFRAPTNPSVHLASGGQGASGGGHIKTRTTKPPERQQDSIIARANAARSAPKPRYEEAEQQYQLAASIAPDDARAFRSEERRVGKEGRSRGPAGRAQETVEQ